MADHGIEYEITTLEAAHKHIRQLEKQMAEDREKWSRDRLTLDRTATENKKLRQVLRYCDDKLSDANTAHPDFFVLDALNMIDEVLK